MTPTKHDYTSRVFTLLNLTLPYDQIIQIKSENCAMPKKKSNKPDVHFRIERNDFDRLRNLADDDQRPLANLVEKIVIEWLRTQPEKEPVAAR